MAQFPQSFRINDSLLQRNANIPALGCFLKQDLTGGEKDVAFSHSRPNMCRSGFPAVPSWQNVFRSHSRPSWPRYRSSYLVCRKRAPVCSRAEAPVQSRVTQLPLLHFDVISSCISPECVVRGTPAAWKKYQTTYFQV